MKYRLIHADHLQATCKHQTDIPRMAHTRYDKGDSCVQVVMAPIILSLLSCTLGEAAPINASQVEPTVANMVAQILDQEHFSERDLDDHASQEWLRLYIDDLDPTRSIFLAEDIEAFAAWDNELDDLVLQTSPDISPAFDIYEQYELRIRERLKAARQALKAPPTYSADVRIDLDRDNDPFPANAQAADELWRHRVADALIRAELDGLKRDERIESLAKSYDRWEKSLDDTEPLDVLERYLGALTASFDPHSAYMKPASRANFNIDISNSVSGIGAVLRTVDEYTVVQELVAGGPAELGGDLQPGDKIIAVGQDRQDLVDIVGQRIDKVVALIRGEKGTTVRLVVIPADEVGGATAEISLVRDRVVLTESDAEGEVKEIGGKRLLMIDVPSFYTSAVVQQGAEQTSVGEDVANILKQNTGVDGVLIDLRHNGGGSLAEAIAMTGLFIDQGPVVQVKDRRNRTEVLADEDPGALYTGPLAVLTSPLSASASEILAGAIQDYGRGIIIGSQATHGKGTVQTMVPLMPFVERRIRTRSPQDLAGALKLTTQQFYRVTGSSTQNRGVKSDIVLPSPFDAIEGIRESDLDNALPWKSSTPAPFVTLKSLDSTVAQLASKSSTRVEANPAFTELVTQIRVQSEERKRETLPLELEARRTYRDALEAKLGKSLPNPEEEEESETEPPDPVEEEALNILRDLVELTG